MTADRLRNQSGNSMHELPSILPSRAILDVIIVAAGQAGLAEVSC